MPNLDSARKSNDNIPAFLACDYILDLLGVDAVCGLCHWFTETPPLDCMTFEAGYCRADMPVAARPKSRPVSNSSHRLDIWPYSLLLDFLSSVLSTDVGEPI